MTLNINDHLPLSYKETPDYCEVYDKNGEKVALTTRPDLFRALERLSSAPLWRDACIFPVRPERS